MDNIRVKTLHAYYAATSCLFGFRIKLNLRLLLIIIQTELQERIVMLHQTQTATSQTENRCFAVSGNNFHCLASNNNKLYFFPQMCLSSGLSQLSAGRGRVAGWNFKLASPQSSCGDIFSHATVAHFATGINVFSNSVSCRKNITNRNFCSNATKFEGQRLSFTRLTSKQGHPDCELLTGHLENN